MNIVEQIGLPSALDQYAEECIELAHACIKMSRKLREENPTPDTDDDILRNLYEEIADVAVCFDAIIEYGLIDKGEINDIKKFKKNRWEKRLKRMDSNNV